MNDDVQFEAYIPSQKGCEFPPISLIEIIVIAAIITLLIVLI